MSHEPCLYPYQIRSTHTSSLNQYQLHSMYVQVEEQHSYPNPFAPNDNQISESLDNWNYYTCKYDTIISPLNGWSQPLSTHINASSQWVAAGSTTGDDHHIVKL